MKFFVFALFLALFTSGLAAVSMGNFSDPDHPGKCVTSGLILSPGEVGYPEGKCMRILCGDNGMATKLSCGVTTIPSSCKFGAYKYPDAHLPKCCKREVICP